jgi:hypothetical protein
VLSAVEGLEVVSPAFKQGVIPITLVILFALFAVQKHGTAGIGKFFGPITLVWFGVLALLGISQIATNPQILVALSPHYAVMFMWANPGTTFIILGAVVLCVTGAEALYADLGHFGKKPIRLAWFSVVMPSLVLNYFGQGALLISNPAAVKNPFYLMAPEWALLPLVGLATMATVIASQALITGAFSVTKQAIQMGYLPRLNIQHTSVRDTGQIYMPFVNWGLFVTIVLAVVMFRSSSNLAAAYGIAVCTDMLITTILTFYVIRYGWKYPLACASRPPASFFVVDFAFFASNLHEAVRRRLVPAADRRRGLHADDHLEGRPPPAQRKAARRRDRPAQLPGRGVRQPAGPRRGHGRVPDRRTRQRAQRAAAQPQAQQGAARAQPVRDGAQPRDAVDRHAQAPGDRVAGPRLLAGQRALRLQERPGRAARRCSRSRAAAASWSP